MSYHCDHCGKPISHPTSSDDLIPQRVDAQVENDDGTWCTIDDNEIGRSFVFKVIAVDDQIAEHYHRACALYLLRWAAKNALDHLAVDGEVPP